mmetsp:Transcript_49388/g.96570  ORF Transcript_49388/g.96570 Transcript_49388/m.96570 type:complete len:222 (+) Transcript_49388:273-938(+)
MIVSGRTGPLSPPPPHGQCRRPHTALQYQCRAPSAGSSVRIPAPSDPQETAAPSQTAGASSGQCTAPPTTGPPSALQGIPAVCGPTPSLRHAAPTRRAAVATVRPQGLPCTAKDPPELTQQWHRQPPTRASNPPPVRVQTHTQPPRRRGGASSAPRSGVGPAACSSWSAGTGPWGASRTPADPDRRQRRSSQQVRVRLSRGARQSIGSGGGAGLRRQRTRT